jgi:hypothetical protein
MRGSAPGILFGNGVHKLNLPATIERGASCDERHAQPAGTRNQLGSVFAD